MPLNAWTVAPSSPAVSSLLPRRPLSSLCFSPSFSPHRPYRLKSVLFPAVFSHSSWRDLLGFLCASCPPASHSATCLPLLVGCHSELRERDAYSLLVSSSAVSFRLACVCWVVFPPLTLHVAVFLPRSCSVGGRYGWASKRARLMVSSLSS